MEEKKTNVKFRIPYRQNAQLPPVIHHSQDAFNVILDYRKNGNPGEAENLFVLYLNHEDQSLGVCGYAFDATSTAYALATVVADSADKAAATGIIIARYYSVKPPSPLHFEDAWIMKRFKEVSKKNNLTFFDFLIMTNETYYSYRDAGIF